VSHEPEAGEPSAQRASVLVATSDSATRDLLRRILHVGAVEVVDASDGLEALALARRLHVDLIVLDAFLAVMDGITVCGRIRAIAEIEQPPIIIIGLISERAVEVAIASGADETLSKPLNPALLRSRTRALLTRRQTEKRVGLMRRALEAAPAGITLLDARSSEYTVAFANPAFLELSGYSAEEIAGHNLRLLMGPETDVAAMTSLRDAMAAGRPSRVLLRNHRKDGRPFWNDLETAPIVDAAGRLTHFVAVQHDVTAIVETPEKEAVRATEEAVVARTRELDAALVHVEKRRRLTETILNSMVSGILATDRSGTVTFANLAALQTLGTSLADCVGRPVVELFGHHPGLAEVIRGAVPAHGEHRLDFPMISPGGAQFYVGMSITPAPPELRDEVGFIILFRNLAETLEDQTDPRLRVVGAEPEPATPSAAAARLPPSPEGHPAIEGVAAQAEGAEATASATAAPDARTEAEYPTPARRVLLALHYSSPVELARHAIDALAREHGSGAPFIPLEAPDDVPEVLLDRDQVTEALVILLARTLERCGDPASLRVRVRRAEPEGAKPGHPPAAVCIDILYPRALITEHDLGPEAEAAERQAYRRADLLAADKLIEANGGQLLPPVRDDEEQALTVLLRVPR
jgi:PAS domain S-box-containing protein